MHRDSSTRKKTSIRKFFTFVVSFLSCNFLIACYYVYHFKKKMGEHPNQHNEMHSSTLVKNTIRLGEDSDNAFVSCMTGIMDIIVPSPNHSKINVSISSFLAYITVHGPCDVRITYEGQGCLISNEKESAVAEIGLSEIELSEKESLPEVHIVINSHLSKVIIVFD